MNLSEVEEKILEFLVEKGGYATAQEISNYIGVTTKTIYRRIKNLREVLDEEIIKSDRRKGYKLNYEKYLSLLNGYQSFANENFSVENRRMSILIHLLTHSPKQVSIVDLSNQYYVSASSIVNDLDYIEKELKNENLILSKTNSGTSIVGAEKDVRKLLMHIFNRFLMNLDRPILNSIKIQGNSTEELITQFDKKEVIEIKKILEEASNMLGYVIEEPYYINLLTHLLILLKRHQRNLEINDTKYDIDNLNKHKFDVSKFIIKKMESKFNIEINSLEINYVYAFLISTNKNNNKEQIQNKNDVKINSSEEVEMFVNEVILKMEETLNIDFSKDITLKKSLLQHVQPMLNRNKYNIVIINPLVEDIKEEFPTTFYSLKKILNNSCRKYDINSITDDEVGYIAVYFQNAIEKAIRQLNVLIICTTGIGTSHLLKTRVNNNFPKLNIKDVISTNEVSKYNYDEIDFILTTVNLPPTKVPQLYISALLDKGDINIIKQFIKNNYGSLI